MLRGYASDTFKISVKESKLDVKTQIWNYPQEKSCQIYNRQKQPNNTVQDNAVKIEGYIITQF